MIGFRYVKCGPVAIEAETVDAWRVFLTDPGLAEAQPDGPMWFPKSRSEIQYLDDGTIVLWATEWILDRKGRLGEFLDPGDRRPDYFAADFGLGDY